MSERIHVAVGVIYNSRRDQVLISKRYEGQHLAGLWELPGGKLENGENVEATLSRELFEEIGIVVHQAARLKAIKYDYPDKKILLDVWEVKDWDGVVSGLENQKIYWAPVDELKQYKFPEANKHIILSILLPVNYLISQGLYEDISYLYSVVSECFSAGLKLFQLRLQSTEDHQFSEIVNELKKLSTTNKAKLILNGSAEDIIKNNVDGIHLNSNKLFDYSSRPINKDYLLGGSCHNEKELLQANLLDLDYVFISPVKATKSHPEAEPLGWNKFNQLANKTNIPVYAVGGLSPEDTEKAKSYGAHGIAMLDAVWGADNPVKIIQPDY